MSISFLASPPEKSYVILSDSSISVTAIELEKSTFVVGRDNILNYDKMLVH
jgi:hypothetical protein